MRQPLRWFWYPTLLALGPLGWLTLAFVGRTPRAVARERLAALPFPVAHDRSSGTDDWTWRVPLASVTVTLRDAPDGIEAERIAHAAEAAAPGLTARVAGATITLAPRNPRGDHLVLLSELLSTWGLALHARLPITGVSCAWRAPTGPVTL